MASNRFNPRARVGRDPAGLQERASRPGFNPRARVGRDIASPMALPPSGCFNPRARVGRDHRSLTEAVRLMLVSIHAPAWGATLRSPTEKTAAPGFQSTRPRGARRRLNQSLRFRLTSFNPRARVGRDGRQRGSSLRPRCFNPRARVGRDPVGCRGIIVRWRVSIHAPAWGATSGIVLRSVVSSCFNPRARVGRDTSRSGTWTSFGGFNPRARVGRDLLIALLLSSQTSFNPRARVGRDSPWNDLSRKGRIVSIHAPAWGATRSRSERCFS